MYSNTVFDKNLDNKVRNFNSLNFIKLLNLNNGNVFSFLFIVVMFLLAVMMTGILISNFINVAELYIPKNLLKIKFYFKYYFYVKL